MKKLSITMLAVLLSMAAFSQIKVGAQMTLRGASYDIGLVSTYYENSTVGLYGDLKINADFKSITTHIGVVYDWHEFVQPYVCVGLRAQETPNLNVGGGLFIGGADSKVNWQQGFEYSKDGINITAGLLIKL